jgi:hypothetical protein
MNYSDRYDIKSIFKSEIFYLNNKKQEKEFIEEAKRMIDLINPRIVSELKGKLFINGKSVEKFYQFSHQFKDGVEEFYIEIGKDRFKLNKKQKEKFLNRIHKLIAKCNTEIEFYLKDAENRTDKFLESLVTDLSNVIINCTKFLIDVNKLNVKHDSFKNAKMLLLTDFESLENYCKKRPDVCIKCGEYIRSNKKMIICYQCGEKYSRY